MKISFKDFFPIPQTMTLTVSNFKTNILNILKPLFDSISNVFLSLKLKNNHTLTSFNYPINSTNEPQTPKNPTLDQNTQTPKNPTLDQNTQTPENPTLDQNTQTPETPTLDQNTQTPETPALNKKTNHKKTKFKPFLDHGFKTAHRIGAELQRSGK